MYNKIANKLKGLLARAIIHVVSEAGGRQFCQVTILNGEIKSQVERPQRFGFASNPPADTACVIGFIGADRNKPVILGDNHAKHHFDTKGGESAQYDAYDQFIYLKKDGSIEIVSGGLVTVKSSTKVRMETPRLEVTGEIIDRCDTDGRTMSDGREIYDTHDHNENNNNGGPTDDPSQKMGGF